MAGRSLSLSKSGQIASQDDLISFGEGLTHEGRCPHDVDIANEKT